MGDTNGKLEIFPDHFEASTESTENGDYPASASSTLQEGVDHSVRSSSLSKTKRRLKRATAMLNLFSLPGLPWGSSGSGDDKVELTVAEVQTLRSEISEAEEREAHLKAQLEHLDELLRSARLAGYLYIRTRWTALPGEPPVDDSDVDDWLPRFVVLHGSCIFFYLHSTDLSPQDSTLLSDVVEVGSLPSFLQEDQQTRYTFYILTRYGLRLECSSVSNVQVDSWLAALQTDGKVGSNMTLKDPTPS